MSSRVVISQENKELWKLALPMIGTQLLWMAMPFIDNVMVGQLGQDALAALGICGTYFTFFLVTAIGVLSALNPLIAHAFGANEFKKIGPLVQSGIVLALLYSLVIIGGLFFAKPILIALGQKPELVELGTPFLRAIAWGAPAQVIFLVFRQYCDAIGFPIPVIIMVFIAALSNIPLDYALIYGHGPFPKLGIAGAGYATASLNWLLAFGLWFFSWKHPRFRPFKTWSHLQVRWALLKEIVVLGIPLAGTILLEVGYFCGSTWLAGYLGALETAAHQISLNIASITFMIPLGLSFAVSVRLGHFSGSRNHAGIKRTAILGAKNTLLLAIANASVIFLFANKIASVYTPDVPTQNLSILLLRIAGLFQIFDGLQCYGTHALRGLKDTRIPFFYGLFAYWVVGMPLSLFLAFKLNQGILGVWYGMVLALFVAALLMLLRLKHVVERAIQPI